MTAHPLSPVNTTRSAERSHSLPSKGHLSFFQRVAHSLPRKRNLVRAVCLGALIPFFWPTLLRVAPPDVIEFLAGAVLLAPLGAFAEIGAEHLSDYFGPVKGGFAHAFMSNFAYLALTLVTISTLARSPNRVLTREVVSVIQRSVAGAIVIDIVLLLGVSLLVNGLKNRDNVDSRPPAHMYAAMLTFSVVALMLPGLAFLLNITVGLFDPEPLSHIDKQGAMTLSTLVAGVLLVLYGAYVLIVILNVRTRNLFDPDGHAQRTLHEQMRLSAAHDGAHDGAHPHSTPGDSGNEVCDEAPISPAEKRRALTSGLATLALGAVGVVWISEHMAHGLETGVLETAHLNPFLLGFVVVPILSSLAELVAVALAGWHGDIQTCLALTVGSAIQVALFVAPVLVFTARLLGVGDLNLLFSPFVLAILFLVTFSFRIHFHEGRTNWLEGVQLLGVFTIIVAIACLAGQ